MKIIDSEYYRKYIGANKPTLEPSVELMIGAANAAVTSLLGYPPTGDQEDILTTRPRRTKYFLSSASASRLLAATHISKETGVSSDVLGSLTLRSNGTILTSTQLPDGDLIVEYQDGGMPEIPEDLKLATALLVDYWSKKEYRTDRTFGGETVSFNNTKSGIPEHIRTILEVYRRL